MFIEPHLKGERRGWIEVICGSMFSGKTEELIRRLKRVKIANVCEQLAQRGIRVIVAGLDMDYLGNPFGQMPNLLAKADYITKLHAICQVCGNIANISYRKVKTEGQVLLGEKDVYEPRCRTCAQL